jgi:uncharacterized protein YndB with AHSA1/START domain
MSFIAKTILIQSPVERVWAALTGPIVIAAWMGGEVLSDPHRGGKYAYFGGETTGVYTYVEPPYRLEYTWRQSTWPADWPDSHVRWRLRRLPDGTDLQLVHDGFPNQEERDSHDQGWEDYWLKPMKAWLEQDNPNNPSGS